MITQDSAIAITGLVVMAILLWIAWNLGKTTGGNAVWGDVRDILNEAREQRDAAHTKCAVLAGKLEDLRKAIRELNLEDEDSSHS